MIKRIGAKLHLSTFESNLLRTKASYSMSILHFFGAIKCKFNAQFGWEMTSLTDQSNLMGNTID